METRLERNRPRHLPKEIQLRDAVARVVEEEREEEPVESHFVTDQERKNIGISR